MPQTPTVPDDVDQFVDWYRNTAPEERDQLLRSAQPPSITTNS
jgi:hypothetical protein